MRKGEEREETGEETRDEEGRGEVKRGEGREVKEQRPCQAPRGGRQVAGRGGETRPYTSSQIKPEGNVTPCHRNDML